MEQTQDVYEDDRTNNDGDDDAPDVDTYLQTGDRVEKEEEGVVDEKKTTVEEEDEADVEIHFGSSTVGHHFENDSVDTYPEEEEERQEEHRVESGAKKKKEAHVMPVRVARSRLPTFPFFLPSSFLLSCVSSNGQILPPILTHKITELPRHQKPWLQPGAKMEDHFNYGFTPTTFTAHQTKCREAIHSFFTSQQASSSSSSSSSS